MGCCTSEHYLCSEDKVLPAGGTWAGDERARARNVASAANKEYQARIDFLAKVPLLRRLPRDQHPLLASAALTQDFCKGSVVIRQGDKGDAFFFIRSGEASVCVEDPGGTRKFIATLRAGDYFGERALLRDEERSATITALTQLSTFKIRRNKFEELGLNDKVLFANRRAVGGGPKTATRAKPPSPKTDEEIQLISKAMRENENLRTITTFDNVRLHSFISVMWKETFPAGREVIKEGDLEADFFYVVQEGNFDILVSDKADGSNNNFRRKVVSTVSVGGSFGELALLYFVPRAATVVARTKATVWVIDRQNFKEIILKVSVEKMKEFAQYLDGVTILESLLSDEKKALAQALVEMHWTKGELVTRQGDKCNTFYILYDGTVNIIKDDKVVKSLSASAAKRNAQYFGESALLDHSVSEATVQVSSESAKTLVVDKDAFDMLLGPLRNIIEANRKLGARRESNAGRKLPVQGGVCPRPSGDGDVKPQVRICRRDLERIGMLGAGGFGTVELWEHRLTGETFALKGVSKGYIVKTNMQESVMNERNILMMTNSNFIVRLYETFNGSQTLYFLLEPALGGELFTTYQREDLFGSAPHASFYIAGTVLALEHLHARRIIYRDLKPENLLLSNDGRIKLTDMGLAKFAIGKTFTTCGTPDYFAPELIGSIGHTNALDWWTLGILTFELMSGHPPFEADHPMKTYHLVTMGISKVTFPPETQGPVSDLIRQLLRNEPSERLPMRAGGVRNIKAHEWYEGFSWARMESLRMEPPFKPRVRSKKDLSNFHARVELAAPQYEYHDNGSGWDKDFATSS